MKTDIPDEIDVYLEKIITHSGNQLKNKKHLVAVAIFRMYVESTKVTKDELIAEVVSEIYDLQKLGVFGKQLRKMPKVVEKK